MGVLPEFRWQDVLDILSAIRWQDAVDILVVSYLCYRLYFWVRYTKAFQALLGLGFLAVLYLVSRRFDLVATTWLFEGLWAVLLILLIILFQSDIHQALSRVSPLQILLGAPPAPGIAELSAVSRTVFDFAERRIGAIVVFERKDALVGHVLEGTAVEGRLSPELLGTIFYPNSPMHDGAVVVRGGRIRRAGCYLPLAPDADLPMTYGTRHRAGLGIAKETDAVTVIVSEERGTVALAYGGRIGEVPSAEVLAERLQALLTPAPLRRSRIPLLRRPFARLGTKASVVCVVSLAWYFLVFGQRLVISYPATVEYRNLKTSRYDMVDTPTYRVNLQLEGTQTRLRSLKPGQINAEIDLRGVSLGKNILPINPKNLNLPPGIRVLSIDPPSVTVHLDEQAEKTVPVRVLFVGRLSGGGRLVDHSVTPDSMKVVGWAMEMGQITEISTAHLDLNDLTEAVERTLSVTPPPLPFKLAPGEPTSVRVKLKVARI